MKTVDRVYGSVGIGMNVQQKRWRNYTAAGGSGTDLSDGRVVTKQKEVNKAIIEILGLDRKSISSDCYDCTGRFLKLLYWQAQRNGRGFFARFLKLVTIRSFQEKLKVRSGKLSDELEFARRSVDQYLEGVSVDFTQIPLTEAIDEIQNLVEKRSGWMWKT